MKALFFMSNKGDHLEDEKNTRDFVEVKTVNKFDLQSF